jgi:predicted nucleic acid-binding protein
MAEVRQVYWDSCVWIGLINSEAGKARAVEHNYHLARSGAVQIWTSTMSYVEVFQLEEEKGKPKPYDNANLDKIAEMFEQEFINLVPVDVEVAKLARRLRREYKLKKPPDAIHLASAMRWSVEVLHTYDGADLLVLDAKLKIKTGKFLRITAPEEPTDGPLFQGNTE